MRKRALGKELRRLREAAEMNTAVAAAELDCSEAKVRHIENGRNVAKKTELSALVRLYGGGTAELAVLEEIRKKASKPGWWSTAKLPPYMQTYVGAETDAKTLSTFTLEIVPGLLQTEEYIRDLNKLLGATDIDRIVNVRARRQQRLFDKEEPLRLHAVCSEAAVRRMASAPYAKAQVRHLIEMSERPNVVFQILPFDTGMHVSMTGGFVLLDFDPEVSMPAVYLEYLVGGGFIDDEATVSEMNRRFTALHEVAMSPQDSVRFIKKWG
nr:Putative DNA-binding protein [Kibdelosporangium sp. MJ126-NF4]